jgi:SAM-dependent methyltransferase
LAERKDVFLEDIKIKSEKLIGKFVFDAGCGNGTLTAAISNFCLHVIGMDLNDGLGLAYQNRSKFAKGLEDNVQYVQGNLLHPPIKEGVFDLVYSSGVIHHTPNSKAVFDNLVPLVKSGGRLYIWVYGKRAVPVRIYFGAGRALKRFISLRSLVHVCNLLAPLYKAAAEVLNYFGIMEFRSRTTKEITLDLFDAFAPRYNHWHTEAEVRSWFQEFGFKNINVSGRQKHGFGLYGDMR